MWRGDVADIGLRRRNIDGWPAIYFESPLTGEPGCMPAHEPAGAVVYRDQGSITMIVAGQGRASIVAVGGEVQRVGVLGRGRALLERASQRSRV